ncbi:MAG: CbiX/SirB N-terminal domain-containing protein [Rhodospirillales bacterium]
MFQTKPDTEAPFAKTRYDDVHLVLAAHGSSRRPDANAVVERHAQHMRDTGPFSKVSTTFLIGGEPAAATLKRIDCDTVLIVPFMMVDGFLAEEVSKRIHSTLRQETKAPRILVADAVGTHEGITRIAQHLALKALTLDGYDAESASVVLVAHGSKGRPESRKAAEGHAASLQQMGVFRTVELAMLEEPPLLTNVLAALSGPAAVVGLFAAPGGHAIDDVHEAIRLSGRSDLSDAGPVGMDSRMSEIATLRAIQALQGAT